MTTKKTQIPHYGRETRQNYPSDHRGNHLAVGDLDRIMANSFHSPVKASLIEKVGATAAALTLGLSFSLLGSSSETVPAPATVVQHLEQS